MVVITLFILPLLAYICWMWVDGIIIILYSKDTGDDLFGKFNDED
jgi:hypothetical protein